MPLLSIKNLCTQFKTENGCTTAVNSISFDVQAGETIGIVGESGSGKSVTALSVMRLIQNNLGKIADGEIFYEIKNGAQIDLLKLPENEMRKFRGNEMAMIFQEPMTSLNPVFTCANQVSEAIMLHQHVSKKIAEQKTIEWFEKVKLPNPKNIFEKYPHQLSGGQKKRVMIAMAMCCQPRLLIADEPTTALDVTVQANILTLMKELQQQHQMSMIFISHDLGVVAEIADRIVVMYKGNIVEQGLVQEIFESPKHSYTKGLLACRPPILKRLKRLPVMSDFLQEDGKGKIFSSPEIKIGNSFSESENEISMQEMDERLKHLVQQKKILEVKNLVVQFPTKRNWLGKPLEFTNAVNDVSFDVHQGETLGLVGESGCGKTTLGKTILGLQEAKSGEIIFDGKNILQLSGNDLIAVRKRLQIIFQDPYSSLNPRMTVGAAIQEPMQVHGLFANKIERFEKTISLLEKVNLNPEHYHLYPHEFSGGQRQRIAIARALAVNPEFIICDESVSALDTSVCKPKC